MRAKTIYELHSALRSAIQDKRLEEKRPVKFYVDSEVVVRSILGFRQFTDSHKRTRDISSDEMVCRALLSAGYLGRVHLLHAHALELDNFVRGQSELLSEGLFRTEVARFLGQYHIEQKFSDLVESLGSGRSISDVGRVMDAVKAFDVSSFVAVELVNGLWQDRFLRLRRSGVLGFEQLDSSIDVVLRDPRIDEYAEILAQFKPEDKRLLRSRSTFHDAFALAQLWGKIQVSKENQSVPVVRFYSEADSFVKAFSEKRIREELSYNEGESRKGGGVLVSPYYFLLRTFFQALSFPHLRVVSGDRAISLDELDEFCSELEELPEERKFEMWDYKEVRNKSLIKPLQSLVSLAFFRSVWISYKLPVGVASFIDGLREMGNLFKEGQFSEDVRSRLSEEMSGLRAKLSRTTQDLREIFELLDIVEPKIEALRSAIARGNWRFSVPSAKTDIGLIRWGFVVKDEVEKSLHHRLTALLEGRDAHWRVTCRELVSEIRFGGRDRSGGFDIDRLVEVCALLWFLEEFSLIVSFISAAEARAVNGIGLEFHLMRAAARLRAENLSREKKESLIGDIRSRIEAALPDCKDRYLIGLAYILAHAASFEEKLFRAEDLDDEAREWLRESFRLGNHVVEVTRSDQSLLRAFAVNHCAYLGAVVGDPGIVQKKNADTCMLELKAMEASQPGCWNFRFIDTILMPRYVAAKETLRELREESAYKEDVMEAEVRKIQELVEEVLRLYFHSGAYFDKEITSHVRRWEDLSSEAKEVRREKRLQRPSHDHRGTMAPDGGGVW